MTTARDLSGADLARSPERIRAVLAVAPEAERLRPLGLGGVLLGTGVSDQVAALAGALRTGTGDVALLMDRRPMPGRRGEIKAAIATALEDAGEGPVHIAYLGDDSAEVHADAPTLAAAVEAVRGAAVLVTVGSGTIADIGKYASAELGGLPHVVVQTAASVNGFADDQSVLVVDGVKRTTPTRWPDRLVIDTDVVGLAPPVMNQAGLGDLLATYTAPADWLLAKFVGQDDTFSPAVVTLARDHVDAAVDAAEGVAAGDPEAIELLAAALTLSGISMGVAGRTAPGSGMEHTASHLLEMSGAEGATLHGAKVGVLSAFAACLWEVVREAAAAEGGLAALRFPDEAEMEARVSEAFAAADPSGAMAAECWSDYRRKLARWHEARPHLETLADRWPWFEADVSRLLASPERLVSALQRAQAPVRLSDLGIDPERGRWALAHCHLMRDRFTIADLAFFMGRWGPADVDALIARVGALGGGL
jgi:glycerol-1-phosphate dehydrogenase [NAD(P)+]